MLRLIGIIILGAVILITADYWLRGVAQESVQNRVRGEIQQAENVVGLFGNPAPISNVAEVQSLSGIIGARQLAEDKFSNVTAMINNPPAEGVEMLAWGDVDSNRKFFIYRIKSCGSNVCPFDSGEMVEVAEEFYDSYRTSAPNCTYEPARWGLIYGFKVSYCTQENGVGELVKGEIDVVSYPRTPFGVFVAKLENSSAPYGKTHHLFTVNFVLGIETFVGGE